jgi:hypothetical protein
MARHKNVSETAQNLKNAPQTCVSKARGNKRSLEQFSLKADTKEMLQSNDAVAYEPKPTRNVLKASAPRTAVNKLPEAHRAGKDQGEDSTACRPGKQGLVVDMLAHSDGASLDELISATGWLPHSTRAVLSRLRKGGYQIDRRRQDGSTRYYLMFNQNTLSA